ncbi:hypothetical protein [Clostridium butyricum]|nr:hypothetical protein [Clostridium butyricum]
MVNKDDLKKCNKRIYELDNNEENERTHKNTAKITKKMDRKMK